MGEAYLGQWALSLVRKVDAIYANSRILEQSLS
jgi:hypothetical protein